MHVDGLTVRGGLRACQTLPFQLGIYIPHCSASAPKDLTTSNLFLRTIRVSMSQTDKQDPEKGDVMGMFSAALLYHSQIHQPIL